MSEPTGRLPTLFAPHGGGPWPVLPMPQMMDAAETEALAGYMRSIGAVGSPRAVLMVSAHWETEVPTVQTSPAPPPYFDYYNFPPEAYALQWSAPGSPALAARVRELLGHAGFDTAEDAERGYDHGTFIPLMLAWPTQAPPVVQLALLRSLDPQAHLAMGRALEPLRDEGVLIVGSGNSWHDLRSMFDRSERVAETSRAFDGWLTEAVAAEDRDECLAAWASAPGARASHPREEHLIPLLVAAGAAGDDVGCVAWRGTMAGKVIAAHRFG